METYLWKINKEKLNKTNLTLYSNFIKRNYKIDSGNDFNKLWKWSVNNPKIFWKSIWEFTKVKGDLGNTILQESDVFFKNRFFPDAKLNYAENLLRKNNEEIAIIFKSENGYKNNLSWKNLNLNVAQISSWMKEGGIKKGDRVAAYLPNIPETVIAYISTTVLGAIWSSCSPDFGIIFSSPVIRATFSVPIFFTHLSKISLANNLRGKPIIPLSYSSIVSTAKCVLPVLVGPKTAVILFMLFSISCA